MDGTPMRVHVSAGRARYDVLVGRGLMGELSAYAEAELSARPGAVLLVEDTGVPDTDRDRVAGNLGAWTRVVRTTLTPTEPTKSLDTLARLLRDAAGAALERDDAVVALGGGITGDVGGFVAATYRRGVRVVQCPTTLLSMVDASVGGKTGVNLSLPDGTLLKNMVGAFHQPSLVVADVDLLASLDARTFRCGLAECVKHALLSGTWDEAEADTGADLAWLETNAERLAGRDPGALAEVVARHVAIKAGVVARDEQERDPQGGRALLNLGHTFAHAIETLAGVSWTDAAGRTNAGLMHGEAVSLGLVAACAAGTALGTTDAVLGERVGALLTRFGLPTRVAGLPEDGTVLTRMGHDKKVAGGKLRLILPERVGRCVLVEGPDPAAAARGIGAIRA